jgi:HJR/Mrr/RecB family endonuclease
MTDIKKLIADLSRDPNGLATMDPFLFENLVAEILAGQGYKVQVTPPTRDGGYDILAVQTDPLGIESTYAVQVKRYSRDNKVGVAQLRQMLVYCLRKDFTQNVIPDLIRNPVFSAGFPFSRE